MENSPYVDVTLDIFETLWREGFTNLGVVLQSALHRSEADLRRVNALGARVRLVKGAYKEPADVAWQRKADVDAAYIRMMELLLRDGTFPALATHDPAIIAAAQAFATRRMASRATASSSRCCTGSGATCRPRSPPTATACAYTFRSAVNGFPITCAASANAPPTSPSCCADCSRNGKGRHTRVRFCTPIRATKVPHATHRNTLS